jgi:L-serine/L-threonine ammonia-lyase
VPILAVETYGAHSLFSAIRAGELVTLDEITSIANTLGVKTVCRAAFESSKTHTIEPLVVTDRMAVKACIDLAGL